MYKRNVIKKAIICLIAAIGISAGGVAGAILGERFNTSNLPKANKNDVKLDNIAFLINDFNNYINGNNIEDIDFSKIKNFSVTDYVNISLYKFLNQSSCSMISIGNSKTSGTIKTNQDIITSFIKNDDHYFKERISYSNVVKLANRFYNFDILGEISMVIDENKYVFDGEVVDKYHANYNKNYNKYTDEDYSNFFGVKLNSPISYIICNDALLNSTMINNKKYNSSIILNNNLYEIILALDASKSTINYRKEILSTIDTDKENGKEVEPRFTSVLLKFYLDRKLNLIEYKTYENYWIKKLGWNEMKGEARYVVQKGENILKIPNLETDIDYKVLYEK